MALSPGTRLGAYEIVSLLGSGGMGEVYRAKDSKLGRDVALKILPDAFTSDSERLARFRREAQVLAALNHPHIGAIYGLEDAGGQLFLVLELVNGESLDKRITRGKIPLDESLAIARQIAEALEAAHEKGIIHRDLKPANIALTSDGKVKVLDFGLAKATEVASGVSNDIANSPTITSPAMMTGIGVILGTAAYMSPEQAKGRPADKRSDVWSFGCVLYEMLTGRRAFAGEDITDTITSIMRDEPKWSVLPTNTPANVRLLIDQCLQKDRQRRIANVAVARFLLTEPVTLSQNVTVFARPYRTSAKWTGAGLIAGAVVAAIALSALRKPITVPARHPKRFAIIPTAAAPFNPQGASPDIAISADGRFVVYRSGGPDSQLALRAIDQLETRLLPNTFGARNPSLSPDGHWVAFSYGDEIKKVAISGGPPVTIAHTDGSPRGMAWIGSESIVFATNDTATGLRTVPVNGGAMSVLTTPDHAQVSDHWFPAVLPSGMAVLYTAVPMGGNPDESTVNVLNMRTGEQSVLVRGGSHAAYVDGGYLTYISGGALFAVPFDANRLEVMGDGVPVLDQLWTTAMGAGNYAIARDGTLVYVTGTGNGLVSTRSLVWVDREGREEPIDAPLRPYAYPRISPDGTRIAVDIRDQGQDIWIWDFARRSLWRLTFEPGLDQAPAWTRDGKRIIYDSAAQGVPNLYWRSADGAGSPERLLVSPNTQIPQSVTPDGKRVVLLEFGRTTSQDLMMLTLDGSRAFEPLLRTPAAEFQGEVSPDGRWLLYGSTESGTAQVYVRPFPNTDVGRWAVSAGVGSKAAWSPAGNELFYFDANNALTAVSATANGDTFVAGNPVTLPIRGYFINEPGRTYDVSADGKKFLMIKAPRKPDSAVPPTIVVVENWLEELKARVPVK